MRITIWRETTSIIKRESGNYIVTIKRVFVKFLV